MGAVSQKPGALRPWTGTPGMEPPGEIGSAGIPRCQPPPTRQGLCLLSSAASVLTIMSCHECVSLNADES